jgi:endonuclease/exonuclease/phosphatase family metal-dependent hydrolase
MILRFFMLILHLACSIALLLCPINAYVSPEQTPFFAYLSLGFPMLVLLQFLLCLYWWWQGQRKAYYFAFVLVLVAMPIYRWLGYNRQAEAKTTDIKVLSYNIHSFLNDPQGWDYLSKHEADIVCLQETGLLDNPKKGNLPQHPYEAHAPIVSIYSRYPIIQQQELLDRTTNGHVLMVDIKIRAQIYRVINMYLNPFCITKDLIKPQGSKSQTLANYKQVKQMLDDNFRVHAQQVVQIKAHIAQSPYPVILAGDLNAVPNSYEYYQLTERLNDAFVAVGQGSATSFHDFKFPLRLDYILTSPQLKAKTYQVHRELNYSDHFPVSASFGLESGKR